MYLERRYILTRLMSEPCCEIPPVTSRRTTLAQPKDFDACGLDAAVRSSNLGRISMIVAPNTDGVKLSRKRAGEGCSRAERLERGRPGGPPIRGFPHPGSQQTEDKDATHPSPFAYGSLE